MSNPDHGGTKRIPEIILPLDEFSDMTLKCQVYADMGYPIKLIPAESFDYFANVVFEPIAVWQESVHREWVEPVMQDEEFIDWIDLQVLPPKFEDEDVVVALESHPIHFLRYITYGEPKKVLSAATNAGDAHIRAYDPSILIRPLMERMLIAACDMANFMLETKHPLYVNDKRGTEDRERAKEQFGDILDFSKTYSGIVEKNLRDLQACNMVRASLLEQGQSAITKVEARAVIRDFVLMLEKVSDEFIGFKYNK